MKTGITASAAVVFLAVAGSQGVQASTVSLVATGVFTSQFSEAFGYVYDEFGDEILITPDSFVPPSGQPFPTASTFTVSFDLDTTVEGDPPIFGGPEGIPFFFDDAVSNLSLDINGVNVIDDMVSTGRLTQFVATDGFAFPDRWNINVDPEGAPWGLPPVDVLVEESPGTGSYIPVQVVPGGLYLGLFDSTKTVYDGLSGSDMLIPSLSSFDSTRFTLDWYSECTEFDCPEIEVIYTATGIIETLSPVPLPAAVWLFGSALLGLGVIKRRRA